MSASSRSPKFESFPLELELDSSSDSSFLSPDLSEFLSSSLSSLASGIYSLIAASPNAAIVYLLLERVLSSDELTLLRLAERTIFFTSSTLPTNSEKTCFCKIVCRLM